MTQTTEPGPQSLERGVWGILATPFHDADLSVDHESLVSLVRLYRSAGAVGVVALGVLGEAARLNSTERKQVLATVVTASDGMPVVAGMSALATAPAVEEARWAADAGALGVMVLVSTNDAGKLAAHLAQISKASGLGIVLQDHPLTTQVVIPPDTLAAVVEASGVVVAVKAESPPTAPAIAALVQRVEVPVFGGLGGVSLLDELLAGSAGAMTGFAVPEVLVATVRAWRAGGYRAARHAYAPWMPLVLCEAQDTVSLAIRKEILRRRGVIVGGKVRAPGVGITAPLLQALDAHLAVVSIPAFASSRKQ